MTTLQLVLNPNLYLRDPQETDLGRSIVQNGISMIDELGFEQFTFKKLAARIGSTEASIYRYFENKHKLLEYIIAWYWNWLEYRIDFGTQNINEPEDRLRKAIQLVCERKSADHFFPQIDETALSRIVIKESDKTYLTKQVDEDNREGLFLGIKSLCRKISSMILDINPGYEYPNSLVSTVLQMAHQQLFFSEHLPTLTNTMFDLGEIEKQNEKFLQDVVFKTIMNNEK